MWTTHHFFRSKNKKSEVKGRDRSQPEPVPWQTGVARHVCLCSSSCPTSHPLLTNTKSMRLAPPSLPALQIGWRTPWINLWRWITVMVPRQGGKDQVIPVNWPMRNSDLTSYLWVCLWCLAHTLVLRPTVANTSITLKPHQQPQLSSCTVNSPDGAIFPT